MSKVKIKTNYLYNKNGKGKVILHLADIHFNKNTKEALFNKILDSIYHEKPDYIIITGDIIDTPDIIKDHIRIKKLVNFLSKMGEYCKVLISLGNHDIKTSDDLKFFYKMNDLKNIYLLDNDKYVDEYIYVYGISLPPEYYYNMLGKEDSSILLKVLKNNSRNINKLPDNVVKICLCHSPINLVNKDVLDKLKEFDLLLSGHMHNGMILPFFDKIFGGNWGLIGPSNKWFPRISRGKIKLNNGYLVINGGVTKLSLMSASIFSSFNFLFNIDINKIILTKKKGRYYGKN